MKYASHTYLRSKNKSWKVYPDLLFNQGHWEYFKIGKGGEFHPDRSEKKEQLPKLF